MFDGRLYRAAWAPVVLAAVIGAFSLSNRPAPATSTLAPDAFDPQHALSTLQGLAQRFPHRRPGSTADQGMAEYVARQFRNPPATGAPSAGAPGSTFSVSMRQFEGQTIDGRQPLTNVIATRPGNLDSQIVVVAHRDAAGAGSQAELSGTAVLLELERLYAERITEHGLTLASTSGGSGGAAGAVDLAAHLNGPVAAVVVLGDLAGARARRPFVVPFSDGLGGAPAQLVRTAQDAIRTEVGTDPGGPGVVSQFAHLALPFTLGEQGAFNAAGLPAVLLQVSGEQGPAATEPLDPTRLENFGRASLRALSAIDQRPALNPRARMVLTLGRKFLPEWSVRLLVFTLLLPVLVVTVDAFARLRRRRQPVAPWLRLTLSCALPFLLCGLAVVVMARFGLPPASPAAPASPRALPVSGDGVGALIAAGLILALGWALWVRLHGRLTAATGSDDAAGVAVLLVTAGLAFAVWVVNPFAAALLVPALHLWLLVASPSVRPRRSIGLAVVLAGLILPAGVVAVYARQLGLDPLDVAWTALLLVGGGHIGPAAIVAWSAGLGSAVAAALVAMRGASIRDEPPVTVRGPLSYAGPGSLGGTESALRG